MVVLTSIYLQDLQEDKMELKPRERKEVDVHFLDEESGIHVKVQEVAPRGKEKKNWFSISVHIDNDMHYNAFDLACATEDQARYVAERSFEFFKTIKPLLAVNVKYEGDEHSCHY